MTGHFKKDTLDSVRKVFCCYFRLSSRISGRSPLFSQKINEKAITKCREKFCRRILSTLLRKNIGRVHVNAQKVIPAGTPSLRGIRMDVEVLEETESAWNVYDIEPCKYHKKGLEKSN